MVWLLFLTTFHVVMLILNIHFKAIREDWLVTELHNTLGVMSIHIALAECLFLREHNIIINSYNIEIFYMLHHWKYYGVVPHTTEIFAITSLNIQCIARHE